MAKVSVIIPVYNSEKYLRQCLDSVINQTFKDIEIICVNDGSTDSSKEILAEYSKKDKRIIVVNQKNSYVGVARNNGIKIATGDYIHFLDSDDWIKNKNTYKYLYNKMLKSNVDVIFFQYQKVNFKTGRLIKRRKKALMWDNQISNIKEKPRFFIYYDRQPWCKFYNRKFIIDNQLKFDEIVTAEDAAFFFKVILSANKIMVSKKSFIMYRVGDEGSLTGKCRFENYECHFKAYESIKEILKRYPIEIRKLIKDETIKSWFYWYHKSNNEYKYKIYEKLHKYFQTMDVSMCESNSNNYYWWNEYIAIKEGDIENIEMYFRKHRIINQEQKLKKYIKTFFNSLKENGFKITIQRLEKFIEYKFKR